MNYILLYNQLIIQKFKIIIDNSIINYTDLEYKCPFCKFKSNKIFHFNNSKNKSKSNSNSKNKYSYSLNELDYHLIINHDIISYDIYDKLSNIKIKLFDVNFLLLHSNSFDFIDGLFNIGSKKIFFDIDKNITEAKLFRYSENYGYILYKNNKVHKITSLNKFRTDKRDNEIFLPENDIENLKYEYFYHTHPITPFIGSRSSNQIIYEFPSIGDILNFVEHHNMGKLLASLVIAPEGLYIIRKFNFNKNKILFDEDIFLDQIQDLYMDCQDNAYLEYKENIIYTKNYAKINENFFYNNIANNLNFIKKINTFLIKYDIAIDFICRNKFIDQNKNTNWIIPSAYLPYI